MVRPQRNDEITRQIIDLIIERDLPPGAALPTELSLMEDIGVSRNSVREAIKALQALGIVEIRHGYGTFVGDAGSSALQTWLLFRTRTRGTSDVGTSNIGRMRDLLEVREMLETELTRRVAEHHRPELIDELEARVARMRGGGDDRALADREFHDLICAEAGIELARELTGLFWDVYQAAEAEIGGPGASAASTAQRHQRIVDALRLGDADAAAEAVHRHFDEVRRRANAGAYGAPAVTGYEDRQPVPAPPPA